jgi:phage repressor protein C with HTH and peptisase S24 domain
MSSDKSSPVSHAGPLNSKKIDRLTRKARDEAAYRSTFFARLNQAAENHEIGDLAKKIGVAPATLYRWLKGNFDPSLPKLAELAAAMDVNLGWLVTGVGPMGSRQAARHALLEGYDRVEFEGVDGNAEKAPLAFYQPWLFRLLFGPWEDPTLINATDMKAPLLVEVREDSMEPTFLQGDLLLVDRSFGTGSNELRRALNDQRSPSDGVYVFRARSAHTGADESAGHLIVRRVQYRLDRTMIVRCDNPKYPEEPYGPRASRPVPEGRVIWRAGRI